MAVPAAALKRWLASLRNDNAQGEYYLTDIVTLAVKDGFAVNAVIAPTVAEVLGINDKLQLAQVEREYRRLQALELLRQGVTLVDPERIDVRGTVTVGRDVCIEPNVLLEGRVHLGDRVRIGAGCMIRDAEIGADTVLEPYCVVNQAVIGAACNVGPFARLRPGARLGNQVHIGNFVEVKNSELGEGSKANHLTYLGDALIGRKVNVGAGTITCNYDGANKWPTVIEDGAFIGSGTMLVAPVTVGTEATTGAGSAITRSVAPGTLAVERGKQHEVSGWQRPTKAGPEEKTERIQRSKAPPQADK
jgi:bifunctional UDP-N-acetylglucosamine pyrophosphorylase / glucosamine-1-phosphate N-acetyltransferase